MKIAYILSAYKLPAQLIRLVTRLDAPWVEFFLHVDKRTPDTVFREIQRGLSNLPNVHFLKRHACYWGDFGHVRASLKGIEEISKRDFDFAVLLTGQDYPIKTNEYISEFLKKNRAKSYIQSLALPCDSWPVWESRFNRRHFIFRGRSILLPIATNVPTSFLSFRRSPLWKLVNIFFRSKRKFPEEFDPFGGSSYWCLSKASIKYILDFVQTHRSFLRYFRHVPVPDEHFFQTILMNSPLKDTIVSESLTYTDWSSIPQRSPVVLTKEKLSALRESGKLFARKFDITQDPEILELIDEHLLRKQVDTL